MKPIRVVVLFFLGFLSLTTGVALADKVVTYRRADARVNVVELRPLGDGGVSLTANVQFPDSAGGAGYAKEGTCDMTTLTAAQRTCLIGIRDKAVACVADQEVGP